MCALRIIAGSPTNGGRDARSSNARLRRHVARRAERRAIGGERHRIDARVLCLRLRPAAQRRAEIEQGHALVGAQHHVVRLEIAVHPAGVVQPVHGHRRPPQRVELLLLRCLRHARGGERGAGDQLHDQEGAPVRGQSLPEQARHQRGTDLTQRSGLAFDALLGTRGEHLDRHRVPGLTQDPAVDLGETTRANARKSNHAWHLHRAE
jgi:hypothetical protein